jgi:hypothetical protein
VAPVPQRPAALDRAVDAVYGDPGDGTVRAAREAWEEYRASDAVPALHLRNGDDQLLHLRAPLFLFRGRGIGPLLPPGQPGSDPHARQGCCGADDAAHYLDHSHTLPGGRCRW